MEIYVRRFVNVFADNGRIEREKYSFVYSADKIKIAIICKFRIKSKRKTTFNIQKQSPALSTHKSVFGQVQEPSMSVSSISSLSFYINTSSNS